VHDPQVVPAEAMSALFEPFRRLHADRIGSATGAGLGLSIVRSIATAHGGSIGLHDNDPGLRVRVVLPAGQHGGDRPEGGPAAGTVRQGPT